MVNMENPKITVIIPTRERCDVLKHALASVVQQNYAYLHIIVSDNFSSDQTRKIVDAFDDSRILYVNPGRRISMSENWEFALGYANDGWVTFMGDDDGLPLGAIERLVKIIEKTEALAIRSRFFAFSWPGVNGQSEARLVCPKTRGFEWRDSRKWLALCLQGKEKYTELPMIYNGGFIHISVLHDIKNKTGRYFSSSSPDVFSAVAIAGFLEKYLFVHEPLSISGTSNHSTGTSFNSTSKNKNHKPAMMFSSERNIAFHKDMPLCADGMFPKSLHALTYESYLQLGELQGEGGKINHKEQLEIILALDSSRGEEIIGWARSFALMHGIDFKVAYRKSRFLAPVLRSRKFILKLKHALQSVVIDGEGIPLRNVYQASVAATTTIKQPGAVKSFLTVIRDYIAHK